jgi:protein phosphatase
MERWLALILRQANASIFQQGQADQTQHGMGTTTTLVWLEQSLAVVGHVGDSRAYLIPATGPWWQISEDHTLLALLVGVGELSPEEAAADPEAHLLYRAVGHAKQLLVDTYVRRVEPGDRLLLCSDGLTRHVTDPEIVAMVRRHAEPAPACQSLVNLANHRGGEDNISLALAIAELAPVEAETTGGREVS